MKRPIGFFDDLLGIAREHPEQVERVKDLLKAIEGPPAPRQHPCSRCSRLAAEAHIHGDPEPPIAECESWVFEGIRYWAATCAACTDYEWSQAFQRDHAAAVKAGDVKEQKRLTAVVDARQKRGRRFHGTLYVSADAKGDRRVTP